MQLDKSKKRIIIIAAVSMVGLFLLWMMFGSSSVSVEMAQVQRGQLLVTIDGEGKTRFHDKITVTAPISGKMSRIKIHEGDLIPKGFVLTDIDPNPPAPRSPGDSENPINPYASKVYAPMGGRVLRIIEKDERVLPAGTPLIEIGNPNTVEIVVDVLSAEAAQVRANASVLISHQTNTEPIKGRVRVVEPQAFTKVSALGVEEQRVNIIADFLTKDVHFGDNFRIDVRIIVWQSEDTLKIPSSALFRDGEKWNVFVVEYGLARKREVKIGHQNSAESEVLEGVGESETLILHPPNQLAEGSSVKVQ